MNFHEERIAPGGNRCAGEGGDHLALAGSRGPPGPASGKLNRMSRVEDHGRTGLLHLRDRPQIVNQSTVTEGGAPFGEECPRAPNSISFLTTLAISQGAMNWPFLTFTGRPVAAAASSRSVWRARNAGTWSRSTISATVPA